MSNTIDNKIVELQLHNKNFEANANQSIKTLGRLEKALDLKSSSESLQRVYDAGSKNGFAGLIEGAQTARIEFNALRVAADQIVRTVTTNLTSAAKTFLKSVTTDQISAGWSKYEQKTAAVQTLVNSTGKSVDEIDGYLEKLMWFSDETSYSFTDMTSALAQMTSSGGNIDKLMPMITGIANATAFAGKGSSEFSSTIRNLAQSYQAGYLNLMDMKSLDLMGTSSKQLKETFISVAESMGKITKGQVTIENFNTTLADKWADTEVMEVALSKFSALSTAAYEAVQKGEYSTAAEAIEALSKDYDEIAVKAFKSAQEAKSFTEAVDATKDAVGSGWMTTFETIIGNYDESVKLWTSLANGMWDFFASGAEARNELLSEWKELGGRNALIEGISNALSGLVSIIDTVKAAFADIFPPKTAEELVDITNNFAKLTKQFKDFITGESFTNKLTNALHGIFKLFKNIDTIAKAVIKSLSPLKKLLSYIFDKTLTALSKIGDLYSEFANATLAKTFFRIFGEGLSFVVDVIIEVLDGLEFFIKYIYKLPSVQSFIESISKAFDEMERTLENLTGTDIAGFFLLIYEKAKALVPVVQKLSASITKRLNPVLTKISKKIKTFYDHALSNSVNSIKAWVSVLLESEDPLKYIEDNISELGRIITGLWNDVRNFFTSDVSVKIFIDTLVKGFSSLYEEVKPEIDKFIDYLKGIDFNDVIAAIAVLGGIALLANVNAAVKAITGLTTSVKTIVDSTKSLIKLKGLTTWSANILNFSIAFGIIAASCVILSKLEWKDLKNGAALFAFVAGSMYLLSKAMTSLMKSTTKAKASVFAAMSKSVLAISIAMLVLVRAINTVQVTDDIGTRILALATLMSILVLAIAIIGKYVPQFKIGVLSIVALSAAMWIMVTSLNRLKNISVSVEGGITAVVTIIAALLTIGKLSSGILSFAASIFLISASIYILITALNSFRNIEGNISSSTWYTIIAIVAGLVSVTIIIVTVSKTLNSGIDKSLLGIAGIVLSLSVFVLALSYIAKVLGGVGDINAISRALLDVGLIISLIVLVVSYAIKLSGVVQGNGKVFKRLASSVLTLTIAAGAIALLIKYIDSMHLENAKAAIRTLGGIFLILSVTMLAMGGAARLAGNNKPFVGMLLSMIFGCLVFMASLSILISLSKADNFVVGIGVVILMFILVGELAIAVGHAAKLASSGSGSWQALLGLAAVVVALGASLYFISKNPIESIVASIAAMAACLYLLGKVANNANSISSSSFGTLLSLAAVILAVGVSLSIIASLPWGNILAAGLSMAASLTVLIFVIGAIGGLAAASGPIGLYILAFAGIILALGAALLIGANGISIFVNAMLRLQGFDFATVKSGLMSLAGPIAVVSLSLILASVAALAFSVAVIGLGVAIAFASLGVLMACVGLGVLVIVISGVTVVVSGMIDKFLLVAAAIATITGKSSEFSESLEVATNTIERLNEIDSRGTSGTLANDLDNIAMKADDTTESVKDASTAISDLKDTASSGGGTVGFSLDISESDVSSEKNTTGLIEKLKSVFDNAFGSMDTSSFSSVIGDNISESIAGVDLSASGDGMAASLLDGMNASLGDAESIGTDLAESAKKGTESVDTISSGENFTQGFINGISNLVDKAVSKAYELGSKSLAALNSALDEHSPSRLTRQSGEYFDEGFIIGIEAKALAASRAAKELGNSSIDAFNSEINKASLINSTATLTPVLDSSRMPTMTGLSFTGRTTQDLTAQLANGINIQSIRADLQGIRQQLGEINNLNGKLLDAYRDGSDLYLEDGVIAGRINRKLGGFI